MCQIVIPIMKKNKVGKEEKDCGGTIAIINRVAREGVTYKLAM